KTVRACNMLSDLTNGPMLREERLPFDASSLSVSVDRHTACCSCLRGGPCTEHEVDAFRPTSHRRSGCRGVDDWGWRVFQKRRFKVCQSWDTRVGVDPLMLDCQIDDP